MVEIVLRRRVLIEWLRLYLRKVLTEWLRLYSRKVLIEWLRLMMMMMMKIPSLLCRSERK